MTAFARPYQSLRYQGYYVQDTWQATNKLTVNAGTPLGDPRRLEGAVQPHRFLQPE